MLTWDYKKYEIMYINFLEKNKGKNFIEINKFERENTIKKDMNCIFQIG